VDPGERLTMRHADAIASRPVLSCQALTLSYGATAVIDRLDLAIGAGSITGLIGANGSGKSTLLRGMGRLLKPVSGTVLLDGTPIHAMPTRAVARRLAVLPQNPVAPELITVEELVAQGRTPHQGLLGQWSVADARAVERAIALTDLAAMRARPVDTLSGGQRQRAWIAMILAQETDILLLDEPTTFLDLAHQMEILELLRSLKQQRGATIVVVLHDLNQAARYCDQLVVLGEGRIVAAGPPGEILTEAVVEAAFDVRCRILPDPVTGTPHCIPLERSRNSKVDK